MTKKEKLINWARKKFENDKDGKILLIEYKIKYLDDSWDICRCLDCDTHSIKSFDLLLQQNHFIKMILI